MTLYRVRSEPGILLSGKPPSEPFNCLKRATRFSISLRDSPLRGRVSRYPMTPPDSARLRVSLAIRILCTPTDPYGYIARGRASGANWPHGHPPHDPVTQNDRIEDLAGAHHSRLLDRP